MNYYIQGCAAKADKIRAAFEKLGMSDLSGYNFGNEHALFYTYDCGGSKVIAIACVSLHAADIIKTHPGYKELELPKPHYGIANFKPFDKVLVRDADDGKWRCNWFSHYSGDGGVYRFVTTKCGYAQCIPFEGNEHLLGTTDMCDERFINW